VLLGLYHKDKATAFIIETALFHALHGFTCGTGHFYGFADHGRDKKIQELRE
jgi:hypothetical protein